MEPRPIFHPIHPNIMKFQCDGSRPYRNRRIYSPGKTSTGQPVSQRQGTLFLKPEFHTVDSMLYYAFTNDTILHTMDLNMREIIRTTPIPFDEFILFNGYTMGPPSIAEQSDPLI